MILGLYHISWRDTLLSFSSHIERVAHNLVLQSVKGFPLILFHEILWSFFLKCSCSISYLETWNTNDAIGFLEGTKTWMEWHCFHSERNNHLNKSCFTWDIAVVSFVKAREAHSLGISSFWRVSSFLIVYVVRNNLICRCSAVASGPYDLTFIPVIFATLLKEKKKVTGLGEIFIMLWN